MTQPDDRECAFPPHPGGDLEPPGGEVTQDVLARLEDWYRDSPLERAPLPAAPAVWTAAEIMHLIGVSGYYPAGVTVAAMLAAGWLGERHVRDDENRLSGGELATLTGLTGTWVTAATMAGPLAWGAPWWLTLGWLAGSFGTWRWLKSHRAIQAKYEALTEEQQSIARKTWWHAEIAPLLGLTDWHLQEYTKTLLGEELLIVTSPHGRTASEVITRSKQICEKLEHHENLRYGSVDLEQTGLPGQLVIHIRRREPWDEPVWHPALARDSAYARLVPVPNTITRPQCIGIDPETGDPLLLTLWDKRGGKVVEILAKKDGGKALALDTPLPTPAGWTTMGDVQVGDLLLGQDGKPARVTAATEVMHGHQCYEVEFSDGTVIVADADHLWEVWSENSRANARRGRLSNCSPEILTTAQIAAGTNGPRPRYGVRVAAPLQTGDSRSRPLPIPPYTLGAWAGDGLATTGRITSADPGVIDLIRRDGFEVNQIGADPRQYYARGLFPLLRHAGVLGNKHIPAEYLRASENERRELLAGLLDTDGSVTRGGCVRFRNTNRNLADAVFELAATLGYVPYMQQEEKHYGGKRIKDQYVVTFTPGEPVFGLARKNARMIQPGHRRNEYRYITDVRPVASVPVRCIQVGNQDELYLAGPTCIPTHNTTLLDSLNERITACDDARLIQINLSKALEAGWWAPLAIANALDLDVGQALRILDFSNDLIRERPRGGRATKVHQPTPRAPLYVVEIDEIDAATEGNPYAQQLLGWIVSKCRSEGMSVIIAGQRGVVRSTGGAKVRPNVDIAVWGKFANASERNHVAGREVGLPDMGAYGEGHPGVFGICELPFNGSYQKGRSFYWGERGDVIQDLVRDRMRDRRPHVLEPALARLQPKWDKILAGSGRGAADEYDAEDLAGPQGGPGAGEEDAFDVRVTAGGDVVPGGENLRSKIEQAWQVASQPDPEFRPLDDAARARAEAQLASMHAEVLADLVNVTIPAAAQVPLLDLLAAPQGTSSRDTAEALGIGRGAAYRWLKKLEQDGTAEIRGKDAQARGKGPNQRFYLTASAAAAYQQARAAAPLRVVRDEGK